MTFTSMWLYTASRLMILLINFFCLLAISFLPCSRMRWQHMAFAALLWHALLVLLRSLCNAAPYRTGALQKAFRYVHVSHARMQ